MEDYKKKILSLHYRLFSAVLFLPILIWLIYCRWNWPFLLLVVAIVLIGLKEYFNMVKQKEMKCNQPIGYLGAALLPLFFMKGKLSYSTFLLMLILMAILLYRILRKNDISSVIQYVSVTFFGVVYVSWLPSHLLALKFFPNGNNLVFYVFAVTWIGDACAYFIGSNWGRHKFIPSISPNKTKEGVVAGISGSILAAFLFTKFFDVSLENYSFFLISGAVLGVVAVFGDLTESLIKRSIKVKDASAIIPGHGGVLDRFDSIFFAAPVMYYLCRFFL